MTIAPEEVDGSAPTATFACFDESCTLALTGAFSVANVATIHAQLTALLQATPDELTIDMSGITELDTAGLQLLLALRRSTRVTRVHSCPVNLREFIETIGLTQLLT